MPPKKVMKAGKKKAKTKAMKEPASTAKTAGRSEFSQRAFDKSKDAPVGGFLPEECQAAHAGVPASEALQGIWKTAIKKTYGQKAAKEWTSKSCVGGSPSCWHLPDALHRQYDHNNNKDDGDTNMVAFLPDKRLVEVPSPSASSDPFGAYILARGSVARELVRRFVAAASDNHGLFKVNNNQFRVGTEGNRFVTIFKNEPKELAELAQNLMEKEFNYAGRTRLVLFGKKGQEYTADYNCITKDTILGEVKSLAKLSDCPIRANVKTPSGWKLSPAWLRAGTAKYVKVPIRGAVHWFNLRMRACRLLRHRHLGSLPNGRDDDEICSQDISESEEEMLRTAPVAWELSSVALTEGI